MGYRNELTFPVYQAGAILSFTTNLSPKHCQAKLAVSLYTDSKFLLAILSKRGE